MEVQEYKSDECRHGNKVYRLVNNPDSNSTDSCSMCDRSDACPRDSHDYTLLCAKADISQYWKEIEIKKKPTGYKIESTFDTELNNQKHIKSYTSPEYVIGKQEVIRDSNQDQGRKFDQEKPRYDLLPPYALEEVVKVLTFGATKYSDENWRKVPEGRRRYFAAAQRHQWQHKRGELVDKDSNCYHLACAITNLMFILEKELLNEKDQLEIKDNK